MMTRIAAHGPGGRVTPRCPKPRRDLITDGRALFRAPPKDRRISAYRRLATPGAQRYRLNSFRPAAITAQAPWGETFGVLRRDAHLTAGLQAPDGGGAGGGSTWVGIAGTATGHLWTDLRVIGQRRQADFRSPRMGAAQPELFRRWT